MILHKLNNLTTIILAITFIAICSSCEVECATRVDNMKIYSVVSDKTTEATSWISGWYRSEFQNKELHFSIEFDHYTGGQGKCNWVWDNYPLKNTIEIFSNKTLYTETDTIYSHRSIVEYFNIETHEENDKYITFLLSEKPESTLQFDDEYYTFKAKVSTDDGLDMEDSCIVKIIE